MNNERVGQIDTFVTTLRVFRNAVSDQSTTIASAVERFREEANRFINQYRSLSHTDAMKAAIDFGENPEQASETGAPSDSEHSLMMGAWELARAGKEKALASQSVDDTRQAVRYLECAIELAEMASKSAKAGS
jgi:hypothetical protein